VNQDLVRLLVGLFPLTLLPGYLFSRTFRISFESLYELLVFSFILGLVGVNLAYFGFRFLDLDERFFLGPLLVVEVAGLIFLAKRRDLFIEKYRVSSFAFRTTFLPWAVLTGVLLFLFIRGPFSGLQYGEDGSLKLGYGVYSDLFWYPGVSAHLKHNFPPELQIYAGPRLKYHYFAPLFIAHVGNVTDIDNLRLYFHYLMFPLIPVLTGAIFYTIRRFTKRNSVALLGVSFFLFQEYGKNFYLSPTVLVAFLVVLAVLYFLSRSTEGPKSRIHLFLAGLFLSNLIMYEAFFTLMMLPAACLVGVWILWRQGERRYLTMAVIVSTAAVALYAVACGLGGVGEGKFPLNFEMPFYKHSVQTYKEYANWHKELMTAWRERGGVLHLLYELQRFFLHVFFLLVHYATYLGVGVLGIPAVARNMKCVKKLPSGHLLLSVAITVSCLFPLLIGWREWRDLTMRTLTLGIPLLTIYAAPKAVELWQSGWIKRLFVASWIGVFFVLPLYLREIDPEKVRKAHSFYAWISPEEAEAFHFIREKTPYNATVLHPYVDDEIHDERGTGVVAWEFKNHYYYMTGLGERKALAEGSLAVIYAKAAMRREEILSRRQDTVQFYQTSESTEARGILGRYPIDYVWEERKKALNFRTAGLLEKVFENNAVALYRNLVKKHS